MCSNVKCHIVTTGHIAIPGIYSVILQRCPGQRKLLQLANCLQNSLDSTPGGYWIAQFRFDILPDIQHILLCQRRNLYLRHISPQQCLFNTIFYFVIQVPIMLILALILAQLLNSPDIKGKGIYRTMIFLPCATSLVSYSMIFKSLFANDGLVNRVLSTVGIPTVDWFQNAWAARWVIVIALVWRWTGYNMVFYLAGLQNIDYSIYEAARIDGASPLQQFVHLTIPLLKPTILLTAIMSTSGTLQLFDESVNLTAGGPGKATMTLTHYIYNISFVETPKFNYAAALSVFILVVVAVLSAIQMKVGDKRD